MKNKEKGALRSMTSDELAKHVRVLEAEIMTAKLERAAKPTKNVHEIRSKRQSIAVSKTILRERELTRG